MATFEHRRHPDNSSRSQLLVSNQRLCSLYAAAVVAEQIQYTQVSNAMLERFELPQSACRSFRSLIMILSSSCHSLAKPSSSPWRLHWLSHFGAQLV